MRKLAIRYGGEPINGIEPAGLRASGGHFVLAHWRSQLAGCGAFRPFDGTSAEIKRMFVEPRFRGCGVRRVILQALEAEARRRGYARTILETALRLPDTIALYRSCGYAPIEPFGPYVGSTRSVCLGKMLEWRD